MQKKEKETRQYLLLRAAQLLLLEQLAQAVHTCGQRAHLLCLLAHALLERRHSQPHVRRVGLAFAFVGLLVAAACEAIRRSGCDQRVGALVGGR